MTPACRGPLSAFGILVLDVMLPFVDALEVTRSLRRQHVQTPILLLTARDAPEEVVRGLDAGADDYLTKPFSFNVLLARIRARTCPPADAQGLRFADRILEFSLLECLVRASGRVVPRDRLIDDAGRLIARSGSAPTR